MNSALPANDTLSPPLRWQAKWAFGSGDFAQGLLWNIVAAFLLVFYTDVALLPAAAIGTLFLFSRIFDAVFDTMVGLMVDRTRSRWGRARPYFLIFTVPVAGLFVLTFWSPSFTVNGKLAWAIVTFGLFGFVFSLIQIPYSALMPMMTNRTEERFSLSGFRSAGTSLSVIAATAGVWPLVNWLGGADKKAGFLRVALGSAVLFVALISNVFVTCHETVPHHENPQAKKGVWVAIGSMLCNRAWRVVALFTLLNFVRFGALLSVTAFFAVNVLQKPWMISILLPAVSGTLLIGAFLAPPYLQRFGARRANTMALVAAILLTGALPWLESEPRAFIAVYLCAQTFLGLTMTSIFAMAAESVDHHEQQFGIRDEGLLSSGISFALKVGTALGSAVTAYGLAYGHYHAGGMTAHTVHVIRGLYYSPAIAVGALQLICIQFYPGTRVKATLLFTPTGTRQQ
jgi:sugar (glycoside-pentoside-hexuronide) transporter